MSRFVVLAGAGEAFALHDALAGSGLGFSCSLRAVADRECAGVCLLAPAGALARRAAARAAERGLPVFCFGVPPRPSCPAGEWVAVAGLGLWSAAWRWVPAVAVAVVQLSLPVEVTK